ncbi:hypothetical protein SNE40_015705 [Patella caerulea]|uniref:Cation-transporting ATPase n=1 Tax=Patella caerulea TaxID=87958 RepID=A0AAN8PVP4_PATCE
MNHPIDSRDSVSALNNLLLTRITLNKGGEDQLECYGYKKDTIKDIIFFLLVILTCGLLLLILYWKPELECYIRRRKCPLYKAKIILIENHIGQFTVTAVQCFMQEQECDDAVSALSENTGLVSYNDTTVRYFDFHHVRYIWDKNQHIYKVLEDLSCGVKCSTIHDKYHGLSEQEQAERIGIHGPNAIDIEVKSYWRLFIEEVLNPFYIFQIASIILWGFDEYYYYASCIFAISVVSICISLYATRKQTVTLRNMVSTVKSNITVCRGNDVYEEIATAKLVPGDMIVIPTHGCIMTCDAVLVAGTCIVNESMLTGESVPVTKTSLSQQDDEEVYVPENHKRHTLFAGTHVVQTRYYGHAKVKAVVIRTGYNTAKGELVRAILFPKPLGFRFYQDAMRFILFLLVVASCGMVYSLVNYIREGVSTTEIILRVLDIITIVVPPALPAAMTVGTVYAQSRLKKKGIFCISPPRINFCGRINAFCFDKTGTLTEDGLDMWGVVPVQDASFYHPERDVGNLPQGPILLCMASCHSLTIIDGELTGDPLDLIMFNSINWVLEEPGQDSSKYDTIMPTIVKPCRKDNFLTDEAPFEVGIVRQFTFSSSMQRMSVITRSLTDNFMEIYCKGAPEKVISLCKPESVPENFQTMLHKYTVQGFRVIALSYRPLEPKITWHQVQRISRDKVERDMTFLGLMVLQNQLKPQTTPVMKTLKKAKIRTVMVTGDMIQTAISVARNCNMVGPRDQVIIVKATPPTKHEGAKIEWESAELQSEDGAWDDQDSNNSESYQPICMEELDSKTHLAISGRSFSVITNYFPHLMPKICVKGTVFARMAPDQKYQLIENLQKLDYIVGMCGDGANDCEALKAAHAGISLSETEASVAAPFTSRIDNIECVLTAMREGRAALVTSFGCFKYMALYSFVQFVSVLILYTFGANFSDFEFLYIDLVITTSIAILMGYTSAYDKLVKKKPPGSLVKLSNLLSIIIQVLLVLVFQLGAFFYLQTQTTWFTPIVPDGSAEHVKCWESTVVFLVSSYMYIAVAFSFSKGPPFRKPIYANVPFLLDLLLLVGFTTLLLMWSQSNIEDFFEMMPIGNTPIMFRVNLLILSLGFMIASSLIEYLVVDSSLFKPLYRACKRKKDTPQYKLISNELVDWPIVGQVTYQSTNEMPDNTVAIEVNQS